MDDFDLSFWLKREKDQKEYIQKIEGSDVSDNRKKEVLDSARGVLQHVVFQRKKIQQNN